MEKSILKFISETDFARLNSLEKNFRDDLIINILYQTGCTVKELVNINIEDIDFQNNRIRIRASREPRVVVVGERLLAKIKKYTKKSKPNDYVLTTRQSPKMTTKRVRQIVQLNFKLSGIKAAGPQILRYTHIVHAYHKGIPMDAIQKQVGLKRSRAIEIFSQLKIESKDDVYRVFEE